MVIAMKKIIILEFFSKLINSNVDEKTLIKLSSGQAARAYAWLNNNGLSIDHNILRFGFTFDQIINNAENIELKSENKSDSNEVKMPQVNEDFIQSIGIDIQSIAELFPANLESNTDLQNIFTFNEIAYANTKSNPRETLTGIFSAKEAIKKSSKVKIDFKDIEIKYDGQGAPYSSGFLISITHSKEYAVAIAIKKSRINLDAELIHNSASIAVTGLRQRLLLNKSILWKGFVNFTLLLLLTIELFRII